MIKIFHTADIHLGMSFSGYPEAVRETLREARPEVLVRMVEDANERGCDLFVVAGDMFDKTTVSHDIVERAAEALSGFAGHAVAVLPGNHDYCSAGDRALWDHFQDRASDHTWLLDKKKRRKLTIGDREVVFWPGPCHAKHAEHHVLGWIAEYERDDEALHIGIAHGSLEGISPDFDGRYFPMTEAGLGELGMDLWLLGHTHAQYPENPSLHDRIFYSATPEPDGFDCRHGGGAWVFDVDAEGTIQSESVDTGRYRFVHENWTVHSAEDVQARAEQFEDKKYENVLAKVSITGRVPGAVLEEEVRDLRETVEEALLHLHDWHQADLRRQITPDVIGREFSEGSFPNRLLSQLAESEDDEDALQHAYSLIQEVRT